MCERRQIKDEDIDEIFAEGAKLSFGEFEIKGDSYC